MSQHIVMTTGSAQWSNDFIDAPHTWDSSFKKFF
jgi:hypothetical protein